MVFWSSRMSQRPSRFTIAVFEATLLTGESPATFASAIDAANQYLTQESAFEIAIDIHRSRMERILPLPRRSTGIIDIELSQPLKTPDLLSPPPPLVETELPQLQEILIPEGGPEGRLERWKRKLLDLSLRNRLLNFRTTKATVPVLCHDLMALEDQLWEGKKFSFRSISKVVTPNDPRSETVIQGRYRIDLVRDALVEGLRHNEIYSALSEDDLSARLTDVFRSARSAFEEGGANTLFLAFGFLSWKETDTSDKTYKAPIILVPVVLDRKSVQHGFVLSRHEDDARVNSTLLEMLRHDFELEVAGVEVLPTDEAGIDVNLVLQRFRRAVRDLPGWEVVDEVGLGLFSFAKYLMWKDLQDRTEDLKRNPVVRHMLEHPSDAYPDQGDFPQPQLLDQTRKPTATFSPLLADSSQLSATFAAADGKSFVLDGPPGTGKSQTITNIIAHCLALNKTVLFVSEKMAALEVVQRRLKQIGLERFCLQLHSAKAKKTEVIDHLGQTWKFALQQSASHWEREAARLEQTRTQLNNYVRQLHRRYQNGLSAFAAIGTIVTHGQLPLCEFSWIGADVHTEEELRGLHETVEKLVIRSEDVSHQARSTFRGILNADWSPSWEKEFCSAATTLSAATSTMKLTGQAREFFRQQGRIGARKRNRNLSPERRSEIARKAAEARWGKNRGSGSTKPKRGGQTG
jgi:hypothetical protein